MDKSDFKFSPEQKAPPRKGRRAANTSEDQVEILGDSMDSSPSPLNSKGKYSEPIVPPRSRKTGGWADDTLKSGKSRSGNINLIEQERFQSPDHLKGLDSDDEIPLIPDIEEIHDEDSNDVADAPIVAANKVTPFSDLDSNLNKKPTFAVLDDINLNTLAKHLYSENDLKEADVRWTWDFLFTEISSDLRTEREMKNKEPPKNIL